MGAASGVTVCEVPRVDELVQSGLAGSPSEQRNTERSQSPVAGLQAVSPVQTAKQPPAERC